MNDIKEDADFRVEDLFAEMLRRQKLDDEASAIMDEVLAAKNDSP